MKYVETVKSGLVLLLVFLAGCGGGGGGSSSGTPPAQTSLTTISGVASKAPISGGTVTAYRIVNNAKGSAIVSGPTGAGGAYSLDLGSYTGPVILEISGGTYTDEATGTPATIPASAPLHTLVSNASGTISVAITPLTELASQLAGSTLTASAIDSANAQVASIFKVYDIVKTLPVTPTATVLNALPNTTQGSDQKDYTLALAAFSQVAATQSMSVAATVSYLKNNISNAALTATAATVIQSAATTYFSAANTNNTTGVTDPASTTLVTIVGNKQVTVTLSTAGTIPTGNSIKGMQFELTLPTGCSVPSDANGVLSTYLLSSGVAPNYIGATKTGNTLLFNVTYTNGLTTTGDFLAVLCDMAGTVADPTTASFPVTAGYKVEDLPLNSGTIYLATVSIAATKVVVK